jgi:hypothetical protein
VEVCGESGKSRKCNAVHPAGAARCWSIGPLWNRGGPNYDEGCAAESRADFAHKSSIALKELKETRGWLKFCVIAELLSEKQIAPLLDEGEQLIRIVASSIITAKSKPRAVLK